MKHLRSETYQSLHDDLVCAIVGEIGKRRLVASDIERMTGRRFKCEELWRLREGDLDSSFSVARLWAIAECLGIEVSYAIKKPFTGKIPAPANDRHQAA